MATIKYQILPKNFMVDSSSIC